MKEIKENDKVQIVTKHGLNIVGEFGEFHENDTFYRIKYPVMFDFVIQKLPNQDRVANMPMIKPFIIGNKEYIDIKIEDVLYLGKVIDQIIENTHEEYKNAYIQWSMGINIVQSQDDIKKVVDDKGFKVIGKE